MAYLLNIIVSAVIILKLVEGGHSNLPSGRFGFGLLLIGVAVWIIFALISLGVFSSSPESKKGAHQFICCFLSIVVAGAGISYEVRDSQPKTEAEKARAKRELYEELQETFETIPQQLEKASLYSPGYAREQADSFALASFFDNLFCKRHQNMDSVHISALAKVLDQSTQYWSHDNRTLKLDTVLRVLCESIDVRLILYSPDGDILAVCATYNHHFEHDDKLHTVGESIAFLGRRYGGEIHFYRWSPQIDNVDYWRLPTSDIAYGHMFGAMVGQKPSSRKNRRESILSPEFWTESRWLYPTLVEDGENYYRFEKEWQTSVKTYCKKAPLFTVTTPLD